MKKDWQKKLGKSLLRIVAALAVVLGIPAVAYLLWQPGSSESLPPYRNNAIWLGHGWMGDDGWFERNNRNKDDFRSVEKISALFKKLSDNKISTVYPHLCPAQLNGKIAPYDSVQVELFLDIAAQYNIKPEGAGPHDERAELRHGTAAPRTSHQGARHERGQAGRPGVVCRWVC